MDKSLTEILPLLIPLLVIELVLMIAALYDLVKRKRVKGGSKLAWALLIVLVNVIGPIIYLVLGREEDSEEA